MSNSFSYLKKNNQYFPILEINLKGKLKVKALVDSGATLSVFRPEIADYLGIPIFRGKQIYLTGVGGRILGYLHKVDLSVDGREFFKCKIVFSKEFTVSFNILGRDNFFIPFLITFNERNRKIVLDLNKKISG